ncbi:hypothetical protein KUTeg_018144 [Tegillarca granosa]|uniref:Uncharacterized protein n=1 Tax=Tegillarca granosa TaxID=220873 RepID=A0ABQ9EJG7_TEGGR|nr:hypothetical protein KUTeg_018144 [Tegillarca granosa]
MYNIKRSFVVYISLFPVSKERYAEKMDLATHYLRECKLKSDEENKQYQRTIKNQEEQIENLKKQILRYEIENTKGEYTQKRSEEDNPVSGNGHIPNRHQIEENIQISPNHVTKVEVAKVKQGNIPENNAQTKIPNGVSKLSNKTREPVHDSIDNLNKDQDVTDGVQEYEQDDDENDSALGADNMGLDIDELDEVQRRNLPVMAEYEGTRTYRSAEGIPLTDL